MADNQPTAWDIVKLNLSRIPWRDFILGMLVPMTIFEIFSMSGASLTGIYIALVWLVLVITLVAILKHAVSMFAIITFIMLLTQTIAGFLSVQYPFFKLTASLDYVVLGLIFIGSMLRPRPFIMALIGKETIERTEAKFGKSKYFFKAWFDINIAWGMFYVIMGIFFSYMLVLHAEIDRLLVFLLGWPAVLVLLYFSVDYPQRYWTKHWDKMNIEIEAAKQYESREATA